MQHIEEAGRPFGRQRLHAAALQPARAEIIAEIERQTDALARRSVVKGLMNIQFAVKDGEVYLIEVNPRASRTVPFVAKAIGAPVAKIAARVMAGEKLADLPAVPRAMLDYIAVKEAVFPLGALPRRRSGAQPRDEVDRRSHGDRPRFRDRVRQGAARRGRRRCRKAARCSSRSRTATSRMILPARAYARRAWLHASSRPAAPQRYLADAGLAGRARQQGRARPAAYRRPDQGRRHRPDLQHHRGLAVAARNPQSIRGSALSAEGSLLHHRRGQRGSGRERSPPCAARA